MLNKDYTDKGCKNECPAFVLDLLGEMSLTEKVGQMVQVDTNWKGDIEEAIALGRIGSLLTIKDPSLIARYQSIATQESRLGIPLLVGNDVLHGYKQIFPIPLALSSSWNLDLITRIARFSSEEASAHFTNWIFAPMVDLSRDPRWGRIAESFGEDVYLGSLISAAWVKGLQAPHLQMAACVKHFAAYGAVEAGRDYNTVDISERRLRETYLPPFKAGLDAGVKTFMTSFTDFNGIPATINPFLTDQILRKEWGFEGVLVSDFDSVGELINHGVAADLKDAARLGALAGVDIDMMSDAYYWHLEELVNAGELPLELIDRSVKRILKLKYELGLFDPGKQFNFAQEPLHERTEAEALLLEAARESLILLKKEGSVLPLTSSSKKIALIGPFVTNQKDLLGSWSFNGDSESVQTILEAFEAEGVLGSQLHWSLGTDVYGKEDHLAEAIGLAKNSDIVVLMVGEPASFSGEAHSRTVLDLPGKQMELAEAVFALGKPVILVVFTGRPLCLSTFYDKAKAVIYAWQGGKMAAQALVETLLGNNNPSGKLTVSIPRSTGQIPVYYGQKHTGRPSYLEGITQFNEADKSIYLDESNDPYFPFGFGLSYSKFQLRALAIEKENLTEDETLRISLEVKNLSELPGKVTLQVYISDELSSISQPMKALKAFKKVALAGFEAKTVKLEIPCSDLAILDQQFKPLVEPGKFRLSVGTSSEGLLTSAFMIV